MYFHLNRWFVNKIDSELNFIRKRKVRTPYHKTTTTETKQKNYFYEKLLFVEFSKKRYGDIFFQLGC